MHVSATLLIWALFLFVLPTLCYTKAGLRRGTTVINFDHHLGACEQGQVDTSHCGIELVLNNVDGAQLFWWKPIFSIGSLICFSALSSTVPGTVPTSLVEALLPMFSLTGAQEFWDISCFTGMWCLVPSRRDNLLKKTSGGSHWCRLEGLTSRGHVTCELPPSWASFASFYNLWGEPTVCLTLVAWVFHFPFYPVTLNMIT